MKMLTAVLSLNELLLMFGLVACAGLQPLPYSPIPSQEVPATALSVENVTSRPNWSAILGPISAPSGWQVKPCNNPALLCVYASGSIIGTVELFNHPIAGSEFEAMLAKSEGQPIEALTAWVENHYATIQHDREIGDSSVNWSAEIPEAVSVGGLPGLRYGFATTDASGAVLDRTLGYVTMDSSTLYVITTGVISGDSTGPFSDNEAARQFEPHLAKIVANLKL